MIWMLETFIMERVNLNQNNKHIQSYQNAIHIIGHPMKPHRLSLTHNLVMSYGLDKYMKVCRKFKRNKNL